MNFLLNHGVTRLGGVYNLLQIVFSGNTKLGDFTQK